MLNKLFQSLSPNTPSHTTNSKPFSSFSQFLIEIYSKISEAILQLRFDRNNPKQFLSKTDQNAQFFRLSLKKIYKTYDLIFEHFQQNSKQQIFIEIFVQNKNNSNKFLVERWTLINEGLTPTQEEFFIKSEHMVGKASIFMRSLLSFLVTTPLWKLYSVKNAQNAELIKKTFLDYSIFFEMKKTCSFESYSQKVQEKEISFDSEEFRIKLKLEFIKDFSFITESTKPKPNLVQDKNSKRGRFLSEGFPYNLENNAKSDNSTNDSGVNNSGIMKWDSDNMCNKQSAFDDQRPKKCQENKNRKNGEKHKNLMSRKDSLILQSNCNEKNIKVLDDEGEEIEVEYVDPKKENHDFVMHTIKEQEKEDNENVFKEKSLKNDIPDLDDDYVILKQSPEPKKDVFIENMMKKIAEMKKRQDKNKSVEPQKNLKQEMEEISTFYLSLIKEEKNDN